MVNENASIKVKRIQARYEAYLASKNKKTEAKTTSNYKGDLYVNIDNINNPKADILIKDNQANSFIGGGRIINQEKTVRVTSSAPTQTTAPTTSTEQNKMMLNTNYQVRFRATLQEETIGEYKGVPITQVQRRSGIFTDNDEFDTNQEIVRQATEEEQAYYNKEKAKQEDINRIRTTPYDKTDRVIGEATGYIGKRATEVKEKLGAGYIEQTENISGGLKNIGLTDQSIEEVNTFIAKAILPNKAAQEFTSGILTGGVKLIRDKPLDLGLTYVGGAAVGAVLKAPTLFPVVSTAITKYPMTTKFISYGLGTGAVGVQAVSVIPELIVQTPKQRYETIGAEITKTVTFMKGYKTTSVIYDKKFYASYNAPKVNISKDFIQPIITNTGKQYELGVFQLKVVQPSKTVYSDTPIKAFLRDKIGINRRFTALQYEKTIPKLTRNVYGVVLTEDGTVVKSAVVTTGKGTQSFISTLKGSQKLFDVTKPNELTKINKKILNDITNGIQKENALYYAGQLKPSKQIKFGKNYVELIKYGRRSRTFTTVSESSPQISKEGVGDVYRTKLGLRTSSIKENKIIKVINENYIGRGDTTKIGGYSLVKEPIIEPASIEAFGRRGIKPTKDTSDLFARLESTLKQEPKVNPESINKAISTIKSAQGSSVSSITSLNKNRLSSRVSTLNKNVQQPLSNLPLIVGGLGQEKSKYYAKGYSIEYESVKPLSISKNILKENQVVNVTQKPTERTVGKYYPRNVEKEVVKTIQKPTERFVQKENQKIIEKQIIKPLSKSARSTFPINIPRPTPTKTPPPSTFDFRLKGGRGTGMDTKGYITFVKRAGKIFNLGGVRSRSSALAYGQRIALSSVVATFGIRKTNKSVFDSSGSFTPASNLFRSYRIRDKEKIPLQDTYIQRKGKRLSFRSEVEDLLGYKKRKSKR